MRPTAGPLSRLHWLRDVRQAAERHGFPWCLWSYDNAKFMSLVTDDYTRALDAPMLDALGLKVAAAPAALAAQCRAS